MTVYIDDADETEEGEFKRNDRTYFLFRVIADTEDELHAVAKKFKFLSVSFDGDVYHVNSGQRRELVQAGAKEVSDKEMSMMIANLYLGGGMGDAQTCWTIARRRHRRVDAVGEQRRLREERIEHVEARMQKRRRLLDSYSTPSPPMATLDHDDDEAAEQRDDETRDEEERPMMRRRPGFPRRRARRDDD